MKSTSFQINTTRSHEKRNDQQESSNSVSEGLISPVLSEEDTQVVQDVSAAGPLNPKSPRIENSIIESLRTSSKDEITSEIRNILAESKREMLNLLTPRANTNT